MSPFRLRACAALLTAPITGPSRCGHMDNAEEALPTCPQPQQQQTAYQNQPKPPTRLRDERFFKKRPTERCEMFETRPRRIASSAISRWLQWLIGRSLSDGFSQVIAITAQICSGVYVAGAPERGASASRSDTDWAAGACRHRPRQYRTVFGHTSSSRALSRTPILSTACKIMRARNANCCEVEWARTSASSASRCAGKTISGSAASQGITTSPLSFRFVMPRRRRFDSCFVAAKQPRSDYLRTFTQGGVATSARRY